MAQRHEVRAWVNPSAWDDEAEAERVIDAIMESGSEDEAEWVRLAGGGDDDIEAAQERDLERRGPGRPAIGPEIKTRVSPELLADIAQAADAAGLTRSAWLRQVIEAALNAR